MRNKPTSPVAHLGPDDIIVILSVSVEVRIVSSWRDIGKAIWAVAMRHPGRMETMALYAGQSVAGREACDSSLEIYPVTGRGSENLLRRSHHTGCRAANRRGEVGSQRSGRQNPSSPSPAFSLRLALATLLCSGVSRSARSFGGCDGGAGDALCQKRRRSRRVPGLW
jgi:hypothetical protein